MRSMNSFLKQPINTWIIRVISFLAIVLTLVPMVTFSNIYFPYIVPRNDFFRIVVALMFVLYTVLVMRDRSYLPKRGLPLYLLLGFLASMTLSSLFGSEPLYSFTSNFERMDGLVTVYTLALFFIVVISVFKSRDQIERILWASLFVAYMTAVIGISQIVGVNLLQSSSGGERITATLGNATYLSAYLLIHLFIACYAFIRSPRGILTKMFMWFSLLLDIVLVVIHFRYGSPDGHGGIWNQVFGDPLVALSFCIIQLLAVFPLFFKDRFSMQLRIDKFIPALLLCMFVLLMINTQTRGAIIGLAFGAFAVLVGGFASKQFSRTARLVCAGFLLAGIIGVGGIFIFKDSALIKSTPVFQKISSISFTDATTRSRLATWHSAIEGFAERPVFGWGVENFQELFNKHFPTEIYTDEGTPLWFDRPHNLLLQYLAEGGVIGIGLYLAFLITLIIASFKKLPRKEALFLLGFIVAYIGQNVFVFDSINSYLPLYIVLAFSYASIYVYSAQAVDAEKKALVPRVGGAAVVIVVGAVLWMGLWYTVFWPLSVNKEFVSYYFAQTSSQTPGYKPEITKKVFDLIDHSPYLGRAELLGVYSEFAVSRFRDDNPNGDDMKFLASGLEERFDRERAQGYTKDARFNMFELNLLLNAGQFDPIFYEKALALSNESIPLSPDRPQFYYIRGRVYMNMKQYDKGIADFKHAVELAPLIPEAHSNLFAAYATMGDKDHARTELMELSKLMPFDAKAIAHATSVYVAAGLYDEAVNLLQEAIVEFPSEEAQFHVGLAQVYAASGDAKTARKEMETAVKLDPSIAQYTEDFYKKLDAGELTRKKAQ